MGMGRAGQDLGIPWTVANVCSFCRQNLPKVRKKQQLRQRGLARTWEMLSNAHRSDLQVDVMGHSFDPAGGGPILAKHWGWVLLHF